MGQDIWCHLEVKCPPSWSTPIVACPSEITHDPPWFLAALEDIFYDGEPFDMLLHHTQAIRPEGGYTFTADPWDGTWSRSGMVNYGSGCSELQEIFHVLRDLHIPFIFDEEGGPDWSPELHIFDGETEASCVFDTGSGAPVMGFETYKAIRDEYDAYAKDQLERHGLMITVGDSIRRKLDSWWAWRMHTIFDFTIEHLGPLCPPNPDDIVAGWSKHEDPLIWSPSVILPITDTQIARHVHEMFVAIEQRELYAITAITNLNIPDPTKETPS